jgi:hypothetical protein
MVSIMNDELNYYSREKNIASLNAIARKLGKRTSPLNLSDSQVQRIVWDWRDTFSNKLGPSDTFTRKLSYKINNLQVSLRVNDEYLAADVKGSFGDTVVCSFANKNTFLTPMELASEAMCREYGCKVYLYNGPNLDNTVSFLKSSSFQQYVKSLCLSEKESLHIGNGQASLYLQRFACEDVLETLEILCNILLLLPPVEEESPNFDGMPENFIKLIPLIKQWAISDDSDRSDKVIRTSSKKLINLVSSVNSDFNAINQYLDSFKNQPLPEHAILLGILAECATEAQLTLKARAAKKP